MRVVCWDDPKKELGKRLENAKKARKEQEDHWEQVDYIIYGDSLSAGQAGVYTGSDGRTVVGATQPEDIDNTSSAISITYAFKNLRFIHAQLSTNAPAVATSPTSNDIEDIRMADAADRLIRYSLRQYKMQEYFDLCGNDALHYGTAFLKTLWNPELGEIMGEDEHGNCVMSGDFDISLVSARRMFIDPEADIWDKVRYVFEEKILPMEQALHLFGPECAKVLEEAKKHEMTDYSGQKKYDVVQVYEYWETGLPYNAYAGRFCYCTETGTPLTPIMPNPFASSRSLTLEEQKDKKHASRNNKEYVGPTRHRKARLPFHVLTDIDVPNKVWGKSFLDFVARPQDVLNRLDSAVLDNLEVHAALRLILPESAEIADDSLTNCARDVIKITGNQGPYYMAPPTLAPDMSRYREQIKQGIDDLSGVNESMFGQQSRETAGFAMQYAVNQGSMIRRRLFNKFTMLTESVYRAYLDIIRENWTVARTIAVLGKENALEAVDIKGADIDGGYDLVLSYGTNLSIDPMTRRQEILQYQPLFEKAGVSPQTSLKLMKLNDLEGYYDDVNLAEARQREYFEEMIATQKYIPPELFEDHVNMLTFARKYRMTQQFKTLPKYTKDLIYKHIVERAGMPQIEAKLLQGGAAPAAPMPDMAGAPGMAPAGAPGPGGALPAGPAPAGGAAELAPGGAPPTQAGGLPHVGQP